MSLVSCAHVGEALTNWLTTATVEQKLALCAALNCGPTDEQIAKVFLDCNEQAHIPGNTIPTCQQMNDAIAEALEGLGFNFASDGTVGVTGDGSVGNPFKLDVKISGEAGNRLEVRNGALGVFDTAPPNLKLQYISYNLGDDNNPGTRDAPLKTLAKAMERVALESAGYGEFSFIMRAGEDHIIDQFLHPLTNADLYFSHYDDPIYGDQLTDCLGYYSMYAPNLSRYKMVFRDYTVPEGTVWPVINARSIGVAGSIPSTPFNTPTIPGGPHRYIFHTPGSLSLGGCDPIIHPGGYLARAGTIRLQGTILDIKPGGTLTDPIFSPVIIGDDFSSGPVPACGGKPAFTARDGNVRQVVNPSNVGCSTDPATKTMFGFTTDWDMFA